MSVTMTMMLSSFYIIGLLMLRMHIKFRLDLLQKILPMFFFHYEMTCRCFQHINRTEQSSFCHFILFVKFTSFIKLLTLTVKS